MKGKVGIATEVVYQAIKNNVAFPTGESSSESGEEPKGESKEAKKGEKEL